MAWPTVTLIANSPSSLGTDSLALDQLGGEHQKQKVGFVEAVDNPIVLFANIMKYLTKLGGKGPLHSVQKEFRTLKSNKRDSGYTLTKASLKLFLYPQCLEFHVGF